MKLLSNQTKRKFIESFDCDEWEIETDEGWKPITKSHKTIPYEVFEIKLEDGNHIKCADDHIFFTEDLTEIYAKDSLGYSLYTKKGPQKVVSVESLGFSESMYDIEVDSENHRFYSNGILSHNTTSTVAYILWYALFHAEKMIFLLANKMDTARDVLFARLVLALENIPFFLQPGCKVLNKSSVEFSSNTKVYARATSSSSVRGASANMIALDEFAFCPRSEEFYTSTYPVISSGKDTKVIITSTPNGLNNMFYRIWQGAITGTNEYKPFTINWWDVPGRDEEWKKTTIANTSETQFRQEYSVEFIGSSDTLIDANTLLGLSGQDPIHSLEGGTILIYREPNENHSYICLVDVSKGRGQDYSTFNIIDITSAPFEQVAVFRQNTISPLVFPSFIDKYARLYNEAFVIIEANDNGLLVANSLFQDYEYDNQYAETRAGRHILGVEMNKKIKARGCSSIKDIIERGNLIIYDIETIREMASFVASGASFEAETGAHDDLMMNLVLFGWFSSNQKQFESLTDIEIRKELFEQEIRRIEDEMVPFGIVEQAWGEEPPNCINDIADLRMNGEYFGGTLYQPMKNTL